MGALPIFTPKNEIPENIIHFDIRPKLETLYVIGNGFDLFHELPTSYGDFENFLFENDYSLWLSLNRYFEFQTRDGLWRDFERDLGSFKSDLFFTDNNDVNPSEEDFKPSMIYCLEDNLVIESESFVELIQQALTKWIESINLEFVNKRVQFDEGSCFMSFNYTSLLENYYNISDDRIWHVHGSIETDELVIGHNTIIESQGDFDENGEYLRTPFTDAMGAASTTHGRFLKPVYDLINSNVCFFERFAALKSIIILGHSLGAIDIPYFQKILEIASDANWIVSFCDEADKQHHLSVLKELGIKGPKIQFIQLADLLIR